MYVKKLDNGDFIILLIYIDDLLIVGWDTSKIEKLKEPSKSFDMKDNLGLTGQTFRTKLSWEEDKLQCA